MASDTGRMSVALDPDKQEKLDIIAKGMDRSRNWIVGQAIDQFLEQYEWQEERIKERLKQSQNGGAVLHSSKDVDDLLDIFKT